MYRNDTKLYVCGYIFNIYWILPELVAYGRPDEICIVLSWASRYQVPRKLSKPAFPSLPKIQVKWCSLLPIAALSSCFVVLAGVDEVSKLGCGERLLHSLERRWKTSGWGFTLRRRGWELGCAVSDLWYTLSAFLFICICVSGLIASGQRRAAHGPPHPQNTHKCSLVPAQGHCEQGVSHL